MITFHAVPVSIWLKSYNEKKYLQSCLLGIKNVAGKMKIFVFGF